MVLYLENKNLIIIAITIIIIFMITCTGIIIINTQNNKNTANINKNTVTTNTNPNTNTGGSLIGEDQARTNAKTYLLNQGHTAVKVQSAHLTTINNNKYYWMDVDSYDSSGNDVIDHIYVGAYDGKIYDSEGNNIS